MAFNIYQQPISKALARSPVLYLIKDDRYIETNAEYQARVFVWSGNITTGKPASAQRTLLKLPDTDGFAQFDVHNALMTYFEDLPLTFTGVEATELVYNLQVEFWFKSDTSSEAIAGTSDTIQFTNGFTYPIDGINAANETLTTFLTDRPLSIEILDKFKYSLALNYANTSAIVDIYLQDDQGNDHTITVSTVKPITNADDTFLHIEVGPDIFASLATDWQFYSIVGRDAGLVSVTEKRMVYRRERCKWDYLNLAFINKYGAWDYLPMLGRKDESYMVDKQTMMRSGTFIQSNTIFKLDGGQKLDYAINGSRMFTMNTDFVDEQTSEVVRQMFLSPTLRNADTGTPYRLVSTNETYKETPNERLINYTIQLEASNTLLNSLT